MELVGVSPFVRTRSTFWYIQSCSLSWLSYVCIWSRERSLCQWFDKASLSSCTPFFGVYCYVSHHRERVK